MWLTGLNVLLRAQSQRRIFIFACLLECLIGVVDYVLPFEFTMYMFYAMPILMAAWYGTRRQGIVIAVFSAVIYWLANHSSSHFTPQGFAWSTLNRMVLLIMVAIGGAAMAAQREVVRLRLQALERTRELEEEILRVSEREKMRIGQDLHDGLCQNLAALDCAMACLKLDLDERQAPEAEAAEFIQTQLNRAMVEARDLARGIFPVQMDEHGLHAALEELVTTKNRLRQIKVHLHVADEIRIREPQVAMHLFRIAQEAVSNASKHAKASEVNIDLERVDHTLTMTISDNGTGLPAAATSARGLGLQTMNYRARSMGGSLDIKPGPAGGTQVRCTVHVAA